MSQRKHVLVFVHAKWCPHCPTKNPVMRELVESCKTREGNMIDIEESYGNKHYPAIMKKVQYFPSVMKVEPSGTISPPMNLPITKENIRKFNQKKKSKKKKITKKK